jgi:hypothetical protein
MAQSEIIDEVQTIIARTSEHLDGAAVQPGATDRCRSAVFPSSRADGCSGVVVSAARKLKSDALGKGTKPRVRIPSCRDRFRAAL